MTRRLTDPSPIIVRDGWGRPMVIPPGKDKPVGYTRCTTFVGAAEDTYALGLWQQRHVAKGVAGHEELIHAVNDTDPDNSKVLNELCDKAKDLSGAGDAMRLGTYLHSVTEAADRGWDPGEVEVPWQSTGPLDPMAYVPDLAAYLTATECLTAVSIEQFSVLDTYSIGGTPDRVVKYRGEKYIADLKTGSIEYGALKIAAQLAVYSRSVPYHQPDHERLEPHGASTSKGIIIHMPALSGTCTLYWVDLLAGWEAVKIARTVREGRKMTYRTLVKELVPLREAPRTLADLVVLTTTADEVRAMWAAHEAEWTVELTELAKQHIASLSGETTPTPTPTREAAPA